MHPSTIKNNRALDLFSGTGIIGDFLDKLRFEVTSLDSDKNNTPTSVEISWSGTISNTHPILQINKCRSALYRIFEG